MDSPADGAMHALHTAIASGNVGEVKKALVAADPNVPYDLSSRQYATSTATRALGTLLQYVFSEPTEYRGKIAGRIAKALVAAGANVNAPIRCNSKQTLTGAILNRMLMPGEMDRFDAYEAMFEVAVKADAKVEATDLIVWCYAGSDAAVAAILAKMAEEPSDLKVLLNTSMKICGSIATPLQAAVLSENAAVVKKLLDAGADVDFCPPGAFDGPLLLSIQFFTEEIFYLLLNAGAHPDARRNDAMKTPVMVITLGTAYPEELKYDIVSALLDFGADAGIADTHGLSALKVAIINSEVAIAELLLESGAYPLAHPDCLPAMVEVLVTDECPVDAVCADVSWLRRRLPLLYWSSKQSNKFGKHMEPL